MSPKLRKAVILSLSGVALGALLWAAIAFVPAKPQTERKVIAISHPASGVTFVASVDTNRLAPDQSQTIHIQLLSEVAYAPSKIEVCAAFPGAQESCRTWFSSRLLFTPQDIPVIASTEPATQVLTVTVKATPYPIKGSKALPFQQSVLRLGPFRIERLSPAWDKFSARLKSLAKDFSWPILVIAVSAWFTNRASRRAEQDEVRRVLLAKVQGLTKRFYTHLVYHARSASTFLDKNDAQTATYHLLSLLTFNARIKLEEGGVFFTNLDAENVYKCAISIVFGAVRQQRLGEAHFRPELEAFGLLDTTRKADSDAIPAPSLAAYLRQPPALLTLPVGPSLFHPALDILRIVTEYENDAPLYEYWYRKPRAIEFSDEELKRIHRIKPAEASDPIWQDLLTSLRLWLNAKPKTSQLLKALPAPLPKPRRP